MSEPRVYGHTASGRPITDAEIEALAAALQTDPDQLKRRVAAIRLAAGNRMLVTSNGPATMAFAVEADGTTTSEVIREALRRFLHAA